MRLSLKNVEIMSFAEVSRLKECGLDNVLSKCKRWNIPHLKFENKWYMPSEFFEYFKTNMQKNSGKKKRQELIEHVKMFRENPENEEFLKECVD